MTTPQRRAAQAIWTSLAALALCAAAAGAKGAEPVATLEQSASISAERPLRLPFTLPAGAREGHGSWYLVRLSASVAAMPTGRSGAATLSADINGLVSNLVEIRVKPGKRCPQKISWATVDLLDGDRYRSKCGRFTAFVSGNFPQIKAIRPGSRQLRVSLEDPHGVLEKVELRPGSGLYRTDAGPAKLQIEVSDEGDGFVPGEWSRVGLMIANAGQRPARDVRVQVEAEPDLEFKRRNLSVNPLIRPGKSVEAAVWIRPQGLEPVRFGIVAAGRSGRAATEVVVEPSSPPEEDAWSPGRVSFLIALGGIALLFFGAFTRKRRPARA
jgi:hypothetical protein